MSTSREFRDRLSAFSELYASLGPPSEENCPADGKIKSEVMVKDNRRYFLDLKENSRGRFLRVSQAVSHGEPRPQIAIPAQGMIEFRDALTDLLEEYGTDETGKWLLSFHFVSMSNFIVMFLQSTLSSRALYPKVLRCVSRTKCSTLTLARTRLASSCAFRR